MPSLGSILQIAKTGLMSSQHAMNVTSHNIANANAEGYTRQRPLMTANPPVRLPEAVYGSGVTIRDVQRLADPMIDGALYREVSDAGRHTTRGGILSRAEALLAEPSDTGLGASLDRFFSAFSDLATNPTSDAARTTVRQVGADLADRFQALSEGLDALRQESEDRARAGVDRVNTLLRDVASLNTQIVSQEVGGRTAGDLRDERGRRLTELSELLPIRVDEQESGSVNITASGVGLVDGQHAGAVEIRLVAGNLELAKVGVASSFSNQGGMIGGLTEVVNTDIPRIRQDLDDLAEALVAEVNALHTTGTNPTGTTGVDFFDAAGITASSLALSADVLASADVISAGTPDGVGAYRAGANDVALAIAGLRDTDAALLGKPLTAHYDGVVLDVGNGVRAAEDAAQVHTALAEQAHIRRESLGGVSIDEELVKLIEYQTAYQASARVVTAAEQMLQSLITM